MIEKVTPEMIRVGLEQFGPLCPGPADRVAMRSAYLAMKALDPEYERAARIRGALVTILNNSGGILNRSDREAAYSALSQTQSQAQESGA